jgi:anti-sigma regulatory factor (Ser/Thr protein kinase)/anti-anti-sigma regulatory factor
VLDTTTGRLEYCTAGHPPPLVVRPDTRRSRYLGHSGAAPLATTGEMGIAEDHLDCGDLVLLYSDGIVQRPGRSHASSTVELGQVMLDAATAPGPSGPADHVCDEVLQLTTGSRGYADDVVLLVAEVTEPLEELHLDLPADETAVPVALEALDAWLESVRVRDLDHTVVQHAADELVSNVVDHAYGHGIGASRHGRLALDASLLGSGEVSMRVSDVGRWLAPGVDSQGRGLRIVRGMVDHLHVSGADQGTTATVRHRLSRPAPMLTGSDRWSGWRAPSLETVDAFTLVREGARLRLTGALDPAHMDDLRGALAEAPGSGPLVLDLTGVSRVPSTAVQALFAEQDGAEQRDQELVLFAPAGSPAQQVLELARLPYVLVDPDL